MKKFLIGLMILFIFVFSFGCSKSENVAEEKLKSVNVLEIKKEERPVLLKYVGTIDSKEIVSYSFKTPGKIEKIFVKKGQNVKKGDNLAKLSTTELDFQFSGAQAGLSAAKADLDKAKKALEYDENNLKNMKALYEGDAISKDVYDQLILKTEVSRENYRQALSQVKGMTADFSYKDFLVESSTIVADTDGLVVEIIKKENEQVGAYYPVLALRSVTQIANVGVGQKDLDKIKLGSPVEVNVSGNIAKGYVNYISEAPDLETRMYNVEIILEDNNFRLGSIAKVNFDIGKKEGVWIPIFSIMNDGEDYVYVISDGRSFKKIIDIKNIYNGEMLVKGLEVGEKIVVNGMKNLSDGMPVEINN